MENRKRIIELLTAVRYTTNDIEKVADEIFLLFDDVERSKQLECDCTQPPFKYNELGICKYCGKQKKEAL